MGVVFKNKKKVATPNSGVLLKSHFIPHATFSKCEYIMAYIYTPMTAIIVTSDQTAPFVNASIETMVIESFWR